MSSTTSTVVTLTASSSSCIVLIESAPSSWRSYLFEWRYYQYQGKNYVCEFPIYLTHSDTLDIYLYDNFINEKREIFFRDRIYQKCKNIYIHDEDKFLCFLEKELDKIASNFKLNFLLNACQYIETNEGLKRLISIFASKKRILSVLVEVNELLKYKKNLAHNLLIRIIVALILKHKTSEAERYQLLICQFLSAVIENPLKRLESYEFSLPSSLMLDIDNILKIDLRPTHTKNFVAHDIFYSIHYPRFLKNSQIFINYLINYNVDKVNFLSSSWPDNIDYPDSLHIDFFLKHKLETVLLCLRDLFTVLSTSVLTSFFDVADTTSDAQEILLELAQLANSADLLNKLLDAVVSVGDILLWSTVAARLMNITKPTSQMRIKYLMTYIIREKLYCLYIKNDTTIEMNLATEGLNSMTITQQIVDMVFQLGKDSKFKFSYSQANFYSHKTQCENDNYVFEKIKNLSLQLNFNSSDFVKNNEKIIYMIIFFANYFIFKKTAENLMRQIRIYRHFLVDIFHLLDYEIKNNLSKIADHQKIHNINHRALLTLCTFIYIFVKDPQSADYADKINIAVKIFKMFACNNATRHFGLRRDRLMQLSLTTAEIEQLNSFSFLSRLGRLFGEIKSEVKITKVDPAMVIQESAVAQQAVVREEIDTLEDISDETADNFGKIDNETRHLTM